jgi:hypothetical protein
VPCRVAPSQHGETAALTWREFEVTGKSVAAGHRRGIVHVIGRYWLVYDIVPPALQTAGVHMALQFAPATAADMVEANVLELKLQGGSCSIGLAATLEAPIVLTGSLTPPAGWVSPRYGEKAAAPQLRARLRPGAGPWGFVVKPNVQDAVCSIVDCATTGGYAVFRIAEGACVDTLLVRARDTGSAHVGDIDFAGSLLWLRMQGSELAELRSIGDEPVRWRGRQVSAL